MGTGGIIGKQNPSTASSASGMWSVNEVFLRNTVPGEWPNFNAPNSVSYNLLGGGGGGSGTTERGNGGGAGSALIQGTFAPTGGVAYTVTIGAGGAGENAGGTSSIVGIANASGGGHGTDDSGQGGSNSTYSGGDNAGQAGGGGAGAGGNGLNASNFYAANGGPGVAIPLHPTGLTGGGGGGGGGRFGRGNGGSGGGGTGGLDGSGGSDGAANTGAGGGGMRNSPRTGGSGRVILRYVDTFPAAATTTGSPTITVSGGYRHYDFTSSGSITF